LQSALNLLAAAQKRSTEAEALCAEAWQLAEAEGRAAGWIAGEAAARANAAAALAAMIDSIRQGRAAVAAEVVQISFEIVRRVAGDAGWAAVIPDIAAQALETLRSEHPVQVRVHPCARDAVASRLAHVAPGLRVVADEGSTLDGCLFETLRGRVDASVSVQLDALERALGELSAPSDREISS